MEKILSKYLPERAVAPCAELIKTYGIYLKIVNERQTKHGDYQKLADGQHKITINASLNQYRFLMTLIHEVAHLVAFEKYGRGIKPHGKEWKNTFSALMLPFLRPEVFPESLLSPLAKHFRNPTASSDTDVALSLAMRDFDAQQRVKFYVFELPLGSYFRTQDGKIFQKGNKRIKRYECQELGTGRNYVIQPHALVELLPKTFKNNQNT